MNGSANIEEQADIEILQSGDFFALKVCREGVIPLSDCKIQSSADGEMELCIKIKGLSNELKASLTALKK